MNMLAGTARLGKLDQGILTLGHVLFLIGATDPSRTAFLFPAVACTSYGAFVLIRSARRRDAKPPVVTP